VRPAAAGLTKRLITWEAPMVDEILDSAKVIVVPVGIGVYQKPKARGGVRQAFQPLGEVAKDIDRLRRLFTTDAYREAGFQVLPAIRGTFATIRKRLLQVVDHVQLVPGRQLVLLWSGHAEAIGNDDLRLATADSFTPMTPGDGWAPNDLVNLLSAAQAQGLYIVLDVCQAGMAAGTLAAQAAKRMMDQPPPRDQLPGFATICSAQPYEKAKDGLFARVLEDVLRGGPSKAAQAYIEAQGYGGLAYNQLLTPGDLHSVLKAEFAVRRRSDPYVQQPIPAAVGADFPIFVNPLWKADALPRRMDELGGYVSDVDAQLHFIPKARGLEPGEQGWNFTGRVEASRAISAFLAQRGDANLLVVTGNAGVGKSAVIGRAVALSDAGFRRTLQTTTPWFEADDSERDTLPPLDGIDAALHLRGLTGAGAAQQLADLLNLGRPGARLDVLVDDMVTASRARNKPLTVVLDALDEAEEARVIAESIIKPLAKGGSRVVVGTRPAVAARGVDDVVELLGASVVVDLSEDSESEEDIAAYVDRRLLTERGHYANRTLLRHRIAEAISRKAARQFLYAKLTVDDLIKNPIHSVAEVDGALTSSVGLAFTRTLDRLDREFAERFAPTTAGATALAVGLAWGEGVGIPLRDQLWPRIATAATASAVPLTDEHCRWFLTQAGKYVLESGDGHQAVYRLYHEALHEHLRARVDDPAAVRARIATMLHLQIEEIGGWSLANPFVVRYLPRYLHREAVADLEAVCTDPHYLARALEVLGVDRAARVLDRVRRTTPEPALIAVAKAMRRARVALTRDPQQLAPQLMARLGAEEDDALVRLVQSAPTIAPPVWLAPVNVRLDWSAELQTTQTLPGKVRAMTAAILNNADDPGLRSPVLFLGAGETILQWDPVSGSIQQTIGNDGRRPIALAVGEVDGQTVIAASSYEGVITVRALGTGDLVVPLIESEKAASLAIASAPADRGGGGAVRADGVQVSMLDATTAVYWSERAGSLCVLEDRLGVVTADDIGFSVTLDGRADELRFELKPVIFGDEPVLAVAEHLGEILLAVADDDSTVQIVGLDGSAPSSVQVNFPIRCLALTWIDGRPIVAAANDSDRMLGTASYVTIRQPTESSITSDGRVLPIIGVGHWEDRLVAVLADGMVHDVVNGVDLVGPTGTDVMLAAGISEPPEAPLGAPGSTQRWPVTAMTWGRVGGVDVQVRGSYDGVIWVWNRAAEAFSAGPFTDRALAGGEFRWAKGRELGAIGAVAIGEVDGATWVVAADSRGLVAYEVDTGQRLATPQVGQSRLTALALGSLEDRPLLVSGSDGGGVTIWDARTWRRLTGFTMDDPISGVWLVGAHVVVQTGALPLSCFELRGLDSVPARARP
jgi:hypothetical protein